MKFVHIADVHFDAPFTVLNTRNNLGEKRRIEQREIFKKVINYIKENSIPYLFISGDLYENKYIRKTTIEYINNLFKEIPDTLIYISPGNHDPYISNSMYKNFNWYKNVKIFNSNIERIELENLDIYGFGFDDYSCKDSGIEKIEIINKNKVNILITHGALDGGNIQDLEYNPLNKNKLKQLGFDYIALGHVHKTNYEEEKEQNVIYSGSLISLGFDELDEKHGMIIGEINENTKELKTQYIRLDTKYFKEIELNISEVYSIEELIELINSIEIQKENYYKIILTGNRNFEINIYSLYKYILYDNIIKIKDKTKINMDVNRISQEINLKGLFVKEILEDLKSEKINEDISEKLIEIGMEILDK